VAVVRGASAALAALFAAWTAWTLPFYPTGWPVGLTLLAGVAAFLRPRIGLAVALAVPILPLGNFALGAALLYAFVAAALLLLCWREPEPGLLLALGPLLAPISALGLVPLLAVRVRSGARRAAQAGGAVLAAAIVAGIRNVPLPFDGSAAPHGLGLAASNSATATASVLWHALLARPTLVGETLALAAAAVLLPHARARGPWGVALLCAAMLAATLLPAPGVAAIPLAACIWATAVLAVSVR